MLYKESHDTWIIFYAYSVNDRNKIFNCPHIPMGKSVIHSVEVIAKGGRRFYGVIMDLEEQYDRIYRYCYFKTRNQQAAEDFTQETFLRYFSQTTYINRGKPLAYLYTIAKNLCKDHYARKTPQPLDETAPAGEVEEGILTSLALRQSLKALPEEVQELILLRYVNDLSVGEICGIVGLSRFAVYRRINNGLKELKTLLREEDFR